MRKLKKGNIYCIFWEDTWAVIRWLDVDEIAQKGKEASGYIKSVGFYIGEFENYVVLAGSWNTNPVMADWGMLTYIPKGTIKKVELYK